VGTEGPEVWLAVLVVAVQAVPPLVLAEPPRQDRVTMVAMVRETQLATELEGEAAAAGLVHLVAMPSSGVPLGMAVME
jgi:hypothetical protein